MGLSKQKMSSKLCMMTLIAFTVALGGCATHGATALQDETKTTMRSKITVGKTTQSEVVAMFGQPQNIKQSKTGQTYVYVLSKTHSGDLFHALDQKDIENAVAGAAVGVAYGNAAAGAVVAGSTVAAGRLGQASNKSDQAVDKTLIVKFNSRGVVSSYTFR